MSRYGLFPFLIGGMLMSAAVKNRLKPCPFCGYKGVSMHIYKADDVTRFTNKYAVLCDYRLGGCGAESGHYRTPEEAIIMWNQRRRRWRG